MTELAKMLLMVRLIAGGGMTTSDLEKNLGVTRRTVTRYVVELRNMGADLQSARNESGGYIWDCSNWEQIKTRVHTWYALEQSRNLLAADEFSLEG